MARVRWHMLWEVVLTGLPGMVIMLVFYVAGFLPAWTAASGGILALALSVPIALMATRELEKLGTWLESLPHEKPGRHPLDIRHVAIEFVVRPALALANRVRSVERTSAVQQRMIEQVVDAVPDPIMLIDGETRVIRANPAAQRSFPDFSPNIALARLIRDPDMLAAVAAAIEGRAPATLSFRPSADRQKEFFARTEPVVLPDNRHGALVALRELTEQLMIERIRSDFVANASHEIKTPLASLQGFIETLQGPAQKDPELRQSFLETMAEETARLTRLVNDLLSLSNIELSATDLPEESCDLDVIIGLVINRLEPVAEHYSVRLKRAGQRGLPPVRGDEDQIHQMLVNLVDNAIKYGGRSNQVMIKADIIDEAPAQAGSMAGGPTVRVTVNDEGPGIAPEQLPRLTERFYRVDKARSRQVGGTGLGLAIVKHIVRRHHGHLDIRSELGIGSSFAVYLPLARQPDRQPD